MSSMLLSTIAVIYPFPIKCVDSLLNGMTSRAEIQLRCARCSFSNFRLVVFDI